MSHLPEVVNVFLHVDRHLLRIIDTYGTGTYAVLFAIVFCETGLVVLPFLPGDSLLFAAGAFASAGRLNVAVLVALLSAAAIVGDTVNYFVGAALGPKLAAQGKLPFVRKKHLDMTHEFYEKYGPKTVVIARFVPIVRTFAPFVAGVGTMTYRRFMTFNVAGGVLWTVVCVFAGFFFGNLALVKKNFSLVILAIVIISIVPGVIGFLRARARRRTAAEEA